MRRAVELTNLAWRKRYETDERNLIKRQFMRNMDSVCVDRETYNRMSAPTVNRLAKQAKGLLKALPSAWFGPVRPVVKQAERGLASLEKASRVCDAILNLFAPFVEENNPCFSTRNIRRLCDALGDSERHDFGFDLADLDWRHYWIRVHMEGLHKWVFAELESRMAPVRKVARARDLVEVFRTACRTHAAKKALSYFTEDGALEATYTYDEFWENACRVAAGLKERGIGIGDTVVLLSKNEPAWPMIYFGILLADGTAVPVDPDMPGADVLRIIDKSKAQLVIAHEDLELDHPVPQAWVGEVFDFEPLVEIEQRDRSEEVASLLFTSGTTGDPKGVMLTHGNFTALLASLHGTFRVDHKDRFLSVLPLFHTFEFSCGLLMPASAGAHITYMKSLEGGLLRKALKEFRTDGTHRGASTLGCFTSKNRNSSA